MTTVAIINDAWVVFTIIPHHKIPIAASMKPSKMMILYQLVSRE